MCISTPSPDEINHILIIQKKCIQQRHLEMNNKPYASIASMYALKISIIFLIFQKKKKKYSIQHYSNFFILNIEYSSNSFANPKNLFSFLSDFISTPQKKPGRSQLSGGDVAAVVFCCGGGCSL